MICAINLLLRLLYEYCDWTHDDASETGEGLQELSTSAKLFFQDFLDDFLVPRVLPFSNSIDVIYMFAHLLCVNLFCTTLGPSELSRTHVILELRVRGNTFMFASIFVRQTSMHVGISSF